MKNKIKITFWDIVLILFGISIVVIIIQFSRAGSELSLDINPNLWSQFGSFIGAFLLAATLIFQVRSYRRQQVEAKFFEMVKYYRDNISEMQFKSCLHKSTPVPIAIGRSVPVLMIKQFFLAINIVESIIEKEKWDINDILMNPDKAPEQNKSIALDLAYQIVYWGVSKENFRDCISNLKKAYKTDVIKTIVLHFQEIPVFYSNLYKRPAVSSSIKELQGQKLSVTNASFIFSELKREANDFQNRGFIKFYGGHQHRLGHYFRHLFQSVKYIHNQPSWLMSKGDKYEFIKTLRAQMSNYEQALLFVNSLNHLGKGWDELFNEYNFIGNLPEKFVPDVNPKEYYPEVEFEWEEKKKQMKNKEIEKFLMQEEKKNDETIYVVWARMVKNIMQYIIGFGIISIIGYELVQELFQWPNLNIEFITKYIEMPILQMVSIGLAAATAVELGYMLFTPGPDEAVQPVMMGIASFVLYSLSLGIKELEGIEIIGMVLLIATIPLLFWTKNKFVKDK